MNKIKALFDFQKFEENPKLNKVIKESRLLDNSLDFDTLAGVTAAGDFTQHQFKRRRDLQNDLDEVQGKIDFKKDK